MAAGDGRHDHMLDTEADPENRKAAVFCLVTLISGIFLSPQSIQNCEFLGQLVSLT